MDSDDHLDLENAGLLQRYTIRCNQINESETDIFLLRLDPTGGVSGFNLHEIQTPGFAGDIYGEWTNQGINFTMIMGEAGIMGRRNASDIFQFQGRWDEEGNTSCVSNGTYRGLSASLKLNQQDYREQSEKVGTFLSNLSHYIVNSPEDKHFYDFTIICKDKEEVKAHKIVLASQTKFFEGLFRQEHGKDLVSLDFTGEIIRGCLRYLYTGEVEVTGDNVQDILMAANYLIISPLTSLCTSFILNNIDLTNCVEILNLGDMTNNKDLLDRSLLVICSNIQEIAKMDQNLKSISRPLFQKILENKNLLIRNKFGVLLTKSSDQEEKAKICLSYISAHNMTDKDSQDLLELSRRHHTHMQLELKMFPLYGRGTDNPRVERRFSCEGRGLRFIRKISVKTVTWCDRVVVGGLDLTWSDGTEDSLGHGDVAATLEVPEGEHISFVIGNFGWYVDNLVFISSSGRPLGPPVGGTGGSLRSTLSDLSNKYKSHQVFLDGMSGEEVLSCQVRLVTRLNFHYGVLVPTDLTLLGGDTPPPPPPP